MTNFNQLPEDVQFDVQDELECYSKCFVFKKADGSYQVTPSVCLHNGAYDEYIGEYFAADVFSDEQKIINYVKNFRSFPWNCSDGTHYEGKKDWAALGSDWTNLEMVNGDLVFS
jgi:hypothetical protein